jgi:hypothetical protein
MAYRGASQLRPWELPGVVAYYQPALAPSYVHSKQNMATGRLGVYTAVEGVAPTWSAATGWGFTQTQYLDTGIIPTPSTTLLVRFSDASTAASNAVVAGSNSGRFFIIPCYNTVGTYFVWGNSSLTLAAPDYTTSGVLGLASSNAYRNGVFLGVANGLPGWTSAYSLYIGARNVGGSAGLLFLGKIQALLMASRPLTPAEVWQASTQMAHLEIAENNVWTPRRAWFIPASVATGAARLRRFLITASDT